MRLLSPVFVAMAAVLGWAALLAISKARLRIEPAQADLAVAIEGSFAPGGQFPGEAFVAAQAVRSWGSWSGSDDHTGSLALGPFAAPSSLRFSVSGYPTHHDNDLYLREPATGRRFSLRAPSPGERWQIVEFALPREWVGRPVELVATDCAQGAYGWLAIGEPLVGGRSDGLNGLLESLVAWGMNGLALGLMFLAALRAVRAFPAAGAVPAAWQPLVAAAVVAGAGYIVWGIYFFHAGAGVVASYAALGIAVFVAGSSRAREIARQRASCTSQFSFLHRRALAAGDAGGSEVSTVLKLMAAIGLFYLALLHLFPLEHGFYDLVSHRFRDDGSGEHIPPHVMSERLFAGQPLRFANDPWHPGAQAPLQSGWQLLTWPFAKQLGLNRRVASGTSALWFQLLWVAAAYGLLRTFAVPRARVAGWVAALALTGFCLQNSLFTWAKLAAGAFVCGAYAMLLARAEEADANGNANANGNGSARPRAIWSAVFAGLAWLAHPAALFSLLPLWAVAASRIRRTEWRRQWLPAALALSALALPWLAFQTYYDPPPGRVWLPALAGETEVASDGVWKTIRAAYARIGWREACMHKVSNFQAQIAGDAQQLLDFGAANAAERRKHEMHHTNRALTWWPAFVVLALVLGQRRAMATAPPRGLALFAGWLALTLVLWCLLTFGRASAIVAQGSLAATLGLFVLFSVLLERAHRRWLPAIAGVQAITLATTWAIANPGANDRRASLAVAIGAAAILGGFVARAMGRETSVVGRPLAGRPPRLTHTMQDGPATSAVPAGATSRVRSWWVSAIEAGRVWWREPRFNLAVLAVLAALLALRRPDALFQPQLWAEDGAVFLVQADLHGAEALWTPYAGYLHLIPRLVAAVASWRWLDPVWWPTFYNGAAFVIWVAVLARFFSRRLALPAKPWLVLAFLLGPNTGEVLFNITNVQWLTAFVLIQQVLIAPPATQRERIGDLLLLAAVALTGPFAIALLPLFAWRWWRDRRADNVAVFFVVAACVAIQVWFMMTYGGPRFEQAAEPFRIFPALTVVARRLFVWPLLGERHAIELPHAVITSVGGLAIAALLLWSLRRIRCGICVRRRSQLSGSCWARASCGRAPTRGPTITSGLRTVISTSRACCSPGC